MLGLFLFEAQQHLSCDTISEKSGIDFKGFFHHLRHALNTEVTKKVKNAERGDEDIEKFGDVNAARRRAPYDP